jgi:hypothetical protein
VRTDFSHVTALGLFAPRGCILHGRSRQTRPEPPRIWRSRTSSQGGRPGTALHDETACYDSCRTLSAMETSIRGPIAIKSPSRTREAPHSVSSPCDD